MWIPKNSKELLENLHSTSLSSVNSIQSFDFSTLYTTIPHNELKSHLFEIIAQTFKYKNGRKCYEYIVVNNGSSYLVKTHTCSNARQKFTEDDVVWMLDFLIDNIYVECCGDIFQQVIGILIVLSTM